MDDLVDLLVDIKPTIPRYCRVNRVIRDIPGNNVVEGNTRTSLRQDIQQIMEPIYDVEVLTPSDYMGAVMSDLQNRRAMIMGMESDKGFDRLNARVPLAELYRYSTTSG